ncbi:hypothetical protein ACOALZ_00325 [Nocardiopsis algeriensis]|uniref:hypothetical protein n=1 Tax=Nocardiopsis algeriensis TaxID=1478215 RepID=UPI003B42E595
MSADRFDSKYQEGLRASVENPRRRAFWAPRSRRRLAVVALAALTLAAAGTYAAVVVAEGPAARGATIGFVVLLLLTAVLGTQLNIATRWVAGYTGLDEYQRAEMARATKLGHHVTAVLMTLLIAVATGFGGALSALDWDGRLPLAVLVPMVVVTAMCHASFPACYLAWTRPDEIPDEED